MSDFLFKYKNLYSSTLSSGIGTGTGETISPASVTGVPTDTQVTLIIDRVDSSGTATPTKMEGIRGTISAGNLTSYTRGIVGTEQAHLAGAVVEMVWNASDWNSAVDWGLVEHNQDGTHKAALVTTLKASGAVVATGTSDVTIVTPKALKDSVNVPNVAPGTSGNILTSNGTAWTSATPTAAAATWTTFSGAYASATTITVAGVDVTGLMKKGVILKWLSSADAFKTGMVISSSFSTDTTITIVGSTVEAGDKTFYYGPFASKETFIIPGTLAAGTDMSKTWYAPEAVYPLSVDARVKTAGTTNSTLFDVNDDGTTIIGTKPTILTTATADLDNVVTAPTTPIAINSLVTVDIDSVSTTAPVEAYIYLFYYPVSLISRT